MTLKEVFESLNLTAYDLTVDMLDVHAVRRDDYFQELMTHTSCRHATNTKQRHCCRFPSNETICMQTVEYTLGDLNFRQHTICTS